MRKSEKLKKIQLLLNQKNLYEDQYERLLAATGDWKSNYTDYLITEPIDLVEELKRVPEADYELCTALLTMLVKEEIPDSACYTECLVHEDVFIWLWKYNGKQLWVYEIFHSYTLSGRIL